MRELQGALEVYWKSTSKHRGIMGEHIDQTGVIAGRQSGKAQVNSRVSYWSPIGNTIMHTLYVEYSCILDFEEGKMFGAFDQSNERETISLRKFCIASMNSIIAAVFFFFNDLYSLFVALSVRPFRIEFLATPKKTKNRRERQRERISSFSSSETHRRMDGCYEHEYDD